MKKKIGIIFPPLGSGGVFQHALTIAEGLIKYSNKFEYYIVHYNAEARNLKSFLNEEIPAKKFLSVPQNPLSPPRKILHFLGLIFESDFFLLKDLYSISKDFNIDLLIYTTPFTFLIPYNTPSIVFIPDLMFKYYPNFPEFSLGQKVKRDVVYGHFAKKSVLVATDSNQGLEDVSKFLNVRKEKIRITSHMPAPYVYKYKDLDFRVTRKILAKYNLPEKFIFYPSQFWYHKNHLRLIKALHLIRESHKTKIPLVLVGSKEKSHKKQYRKILAEIKKLNMEKEIVHLGYISDKEIVALYKKSVALVFPSLFGPTNIPLLEAMVLGVPVVCSDLFEMPKQVGGAGVLFDPFDIKDMAEKIHRIWTNEDLREELIQKGFERVKELTLENFAKKWEEIIEEALKLK